jgi:hypothetical protein
MGPTNLISIIHDKPFEQVRQILTESPYHLSVSDEDDMYMLNFTDNSDLKNPACREANGTIFQKDTNKLLHYSFAKTFEGFSAETAKDVFECDKVNDHSVEKNGQEIPFTIQLFTEGSLIKVFYHDSEWKVATSHRINAAFSFGGSKSFKEMLFEAFDETGLSYADLVDAERFCYTLILQHPENHICMDIQVPFAALLNKVNLTDYSETNLADGYLMDKPLSYFKDTNTNILLFIGGDRVKILSSEYVADKCILGNHSNVKCIYLNCVREGNRDYVRERLQSKLKIFDAIDKRIDEEISLIFYEYKIRHVEKRKLDVITGHRKIIYQLHGDYLGSRVPINKQAVYDKLFSLPTQKLLWILDC